MGWIDRRPRNVTAQLLEFAASGRLIEGTRSRRDRRGTIVVVVASSVVLGIGLGLAGAGALGSGSDAVVLVATMVTLGALAVLVPAIRLLRTAPPAPPVAVRPGAVLPPELIRAGNWIHRDGAWVRVEHIGRDGRGRVEALLSTREVVTLVAPATIAGDDFRPTADAFESLRR